MPVSSSPALYVLRSRLAHAEGWRTFVEIESVVPGRYFRLVDDNRHLHADAKLWQACGLDVTLPEMSVEGTLGELTVSIPNISRLPLAYAEAENDIIGCKVTAWVAHSANLATFAGGNAFDFRHVCTAVRASEERFEITCRHLAAGGVGGRKVPHRRYDRRAFPQLVGAMRGAR